VPSLLDGAQVRMVTSGRVAIGLALRALGVGTGDIVLVPAYHSPSMIPPVHWCGAEAVFYRVHPDTTADLDDIAAKLDARGAATVKAIMATHFFGFPQDLTLLRALCDRHGIGLVEDCAHCFFGARAGVPIGSTGDYAIGSNMKFFPIYDGGCLVSRRHALGIRLHASGAGFEVKSALNALEAGFAYGRMQGLRAVLALPLRAKTMLWNALKARAHKQGAVPDQGAARLAPSSSDSSFDFDPYWADKRCSLFSRLVMRFASHARIITRRRHHYLALQQALSGLPGCRPLFTTLPDDACPWVFPLLVDRPGPLVAALDAANVPMVRFGAVLWPGVDNTVCSNSVTLGQRLVAFPCHQDLSDAELGSLSTAIRCAFDSIAAVPA
jgi:perosamine synthetase